MTYLTLINKILSRLRESEVLTPTDTDYAVLIGALVNDAKRTVEKAWDWTALRTSKTVSATVSDNTYTITGAGTDFKLLDAYNYTTQSRLKLVDKTTMNTWINLNTAPTGSPTHFTYNGQDSNGDQNIIVYPTPDGSYSLVFDLIVREPELEDAADATVLPSHPIVMYAWALATRERGETGGIAAQEIFGLADRSLADAVALDAMRYDGELTWKAI